MFGTKPWGTEPIGTTLPLRAKLSPTLAASKPDLSPIPHTRAALVL